MVIDLGFKLIFQTNKDESWSFIKNVEQREGYFSLNLKLLRKYLYRYETIKDYHEKATHVSMILTFLPPIIRDQREGFLKERIPTGTSCTDYIKIPLNLLLR